MFKILAFVFVYQLKLLLLFVISYLKLSINVYV